MSVKYLLFFVNNYEIIKDTVKVSEAHSNDDCLLDHFMAFYYIVCALNLVLYFFVFVLLISIGYHRKRINNANIDTGR